MYIRRSIESYIREAVGSFPCLALYGARQVGKSTTLREMFPDVRYVTLDRASDMALANDNPRLFLETYGWPLLIDEIQKAPGLLQEIKIIVDEERFKRLHSDEPQPLMYLLTGSNQFALLESTSESLAGRMAVAQMQPLSLSEKRGIADAPFIPDIKVLLERERTQKPPVMTRAAVFEQIFEGGMPDIVVHKSKREVYYAAYLSTYIEKDVRRLISADKETDFLNFVHLLALRTAQPLNLDNISRDAGIHMQTCKRWLSILSSSGIIRLMQPYMPSASTRIIKSPKVYFVDTGLCAYLCKWPDAKMLEMGAMSGAFYETFVVSEVWKSFLNAGLKPEDSLYYYRDKDRHEVDLVYVGQGTITPIEIKKGIRPEKPSKNFRVLEKYKLPLNPGIIIDSAEHISPLNENAYICPVSLIGV